MKSLAWLEIAGAIGQMQDTYSTGAGQVQDINSGDTPLILRVYFADASISLHGHILSHSEGELYDGLHDRQQI